MKKFSTLAIAIGFGLMSSASFAQTNHPGPSRSDKNAPPTSQSTKGPGGMVNPNQSGEGSSGGAGAGTSGSAGSAGGGTGGGAGGSAGGAGSGAGGSGAGGAGGAGGGSGGSGR
jgi:hypothetical protein